MGRSRVRNRPRRNNGWRSFASNAFSTAAKVGIGYLSKGNGSSTGSKTVVVKSRDHGGITTQHDSRVLYRNKKMPYRKKKAWKKFTRKVKAVEISDRAKQTLVINSRVSGSTSFGTGLYQNWSECHLYPAISSSSGCRDISIILEDIMTYKQDIKGGTIGSADVGQQVPEDTSTNFRSTRKEILFSSASLDVTYTNTGTTGMELDLYTIVYPRQAAGTDNDFLSAVQQNTNIVDPIRVVSGTTIVAATPVTIYQRGVTLFDVAYGMANTGAKIIKKEKFFISGGNSITKNLRDPANHKFRMPTDTNVYHLKGMTRTLVCCFKPVNALQDATLEQKATRTYKYTYEGGAVPYNRYV